MKDVTTCKWEKKDCEHVDTSADTVRSNTKHVVVANGEKKKKQRVSPQLHACRSKQSSIGLKELLESDLGLCSRFYWTPFHSLGVDVRKKGGKKVISFSLSIRKTLLQKRLVVQILLESSLSLGKTLYPHRFILVVVGPLLGGCVHV